MDGVHLARGVEALSLSDPEWQEGLLITPFLNCADRTKRISLGVKVCDQFLDGAEFLALLRLDLL